MLWSPRRTGYACRSVFSGWGRRRGRVSSVLRSKTLAPLTLRPTRRRSVSRFGKSLALHIPAQRYVLRLRKPTFSKSAFAESMIRRMQLPRFPLFLAESSPRNSRSAMRRGIEASRNEHFVQCLRSFERNETATRSARVARVEDRTQLVKFGAKKGTEGIQHFVIGIEPHEVFCTRLVILGLLAPGWSEGIGARIGSGPGCFPMRPNPVAIKIGTELLPLKSSDYGRKDNGISLFQISFSFLFRGWLIPWHRSLHGDRLPAGITY